MTRLHTQPATMTSAAPDRPRVVALHRAHSVSGVRVAGARLARLADPHLPWRPLVIGADVTPARVAASALHAAPGLDRLSWGGGLDPARQVLLVRDRLRELGAGVVVPNDLPHGFIAAALDAHRGVRCAAVCHGIDGLSLDLYERCLPLAHAWRAVSGEIARRVMQFVPGTRTPAPLPLGLPVPSRPVSVVTPAPPDRPLRLLYAGWLDNLNKRVLDLGELADHLAELGVVFRLSIVGDGPVREALARRLEDHTRAGRARLPGAAPPAAMADLYKEHDLLLLVSRAEGAPLVVMEAMAHGRPVAITAGCGHAAAVCRDDVDSFVVPTGAMREMAEKIASHWRHPEQLAAMGRAAHATARAHFDLDTLAPQYDRLILDAAAAHSFACDAEPDTEPHADPATDPRSPARLAALWHQIVAALELIGPCDAPSLLALALSWLSDLGITGVWLDAPHSLPSMLDALGPGSRGVIEGLVMRPGNTTFMGWPTRHARDLAPATLVLSDGSSFSDEDQPPDDLHLMRLRTPGLVSPVGRMFLTKVEELARAGLSRLAIYGGGRHTLRLRHALARTDRVAVIIDDRVGLPGGPPDRLWGLPVVPPSRLHEFDADAIIISSDEFEETLLAKAQEFKGHRPVVTLYRAGED
ncbi:MAG: glycosyltransferase family 4 protein [Phycisphaerae bacterium]|nr:glycosyltransferase family 4 protein [Phycisphaerae bacterium]